MGGIAVDVSDIDDRLHYVTLTPAGLVFLARRGHFVEIFDRDIRDKSKADIFAKCLVILQVSWIALQTISRKASGYPLSPLEIHTLVHAACASVMYILWFRKPLDVQAPIIVSKAGFEDVIALMLMQNPPLSKTWFSHLDPPTNHDMVIYGERSEASFLMFDDTVLSQRDEGCSSCGGHSTRSTTTDTEVANKDVIPVFPRTCENCVTLSDSERQQARISGAHILSSQIISHPRASIRCRPPRGVKRVCKLRPGEFTSEGIGLRPLETRHPYHDLYVPKKRRLGLWRSLDPGPPKPALPAQISPALKARLPEPSAWRKNPTYSYQIKLSLSEKDLKRWRLAGAAFLKHTDIQEEYDPGNGRYRSFETEIKGRPCTSHLLVRRRCNLNGQLPDAGVGNRLLYIFCLLASLYGGIHLVLWNYNFPTPAECLLWKISAATLLSTPALLVIIALLITPCLPHNDDNSSGRPTLTDWLLKTFPRFCSAVRYMWKVLHGKVFLYGLILILTLAFGLALPLYMFGRIFIVVESFISLRHVPIGVYEGGFGWSQYVPHL